MTLLQPKHDGLRVFVYFNQHKRVWSVKALEGKHKGRVIGYTRSLCLTDCTFKVSEAGRQRVLREKRKNVHAGVVGTLNTFAIMPDEKPIKVRYNPYEVRHFVTTDRYAINHPVFKATMVIMSTQRGVEAYGAS
jgi:hypothetical protein